MTNCNDPQAGLIALAVIGAYFLLSPILTWLGWQ